MSLICQCGIMALAFPPKWGAGAGIGRSVLLFPSWARRSGNAQPPWAYTNHRKNERPAPDATPIRGGRPTSEIAKGGHAARNFPLRPVCYPGWVFLRGWVAVPGLGDGSALRLAFAVIPPFWHGETDTTIPRIKHQAPTQKSRRPALDATPI